jgi:hypothetical protein
MYGLEASERDPLPCAGPQPRSAAECVPNGTARLVAPNSLMAIGREWVIPRLEGIPTEYRLFDGIDMASKLSKMLISTGLADAARWVQVGRDPFRFIEQALKDRVVADGGPEIEKEFFLRLGLVSDLDPYGNDDSDHMGPEGEMFLVIEPESAGYVVMGPTLRLLKTVHPRLPVTFFDLFTGALNRWIRVYDYRDAVERVEQLREWYEGDPEGETVELPAVDAAIPDCLRQEWNPLKERFVDQVAGRVRNQKARALLEGVIELNRVSLEGKRPDIGERAQARFMDANPPVPALVAVFSKNDAIEGCFDEECQGMLECPPEPNVILPFRVEDSKSVREAFRLLAVICNILGQGARLITLMMELVK